MLWLLSSPLLEQDERFSERDLLLTLLGKLTFLLILRMMQEELLTNLEVENQALKAALEQLRTERARSRSRSDASSIPGIANGRGRNRRSSINGGVRNSYREVRSHSHVLLFTYVL